MATYKNAYDKLYDNMKNAFTVVNDGAETTLGEYMLRHAKAKNGSNLPIAAYSKDNAVEAIYSYVNSKLTIKTPPVKDKTIRAFPIRSCAAALLSAVVMSSVALSYIGFVAPDAQKAYVVEINEIDPTDTIQASDVKIG